MENTNTSGGYAWLNVVKKAFRSPTKSNKSSKRREEHEQEDHKKKRGKRTWIFSKTCIHESTIQHYESADSEYLRTLAVNDKKTKADGLSQQQAIALAMVTTAAAQAAVATAQATVEAIRLASPMKAARKYYSAAVVIQTAFRGYLARKALRALRGVVRLQALVRGYNVRKRAKMTLQCIQSLVKLQDRVCDQRRRLSFESSKEAMFTASKSLKEIHVGTKKCRSREGSSIEDKWSGHQHTLQEIKAMLQKAKEAASERENSLSTNFSRQMWRCGKDQFLCKKREEKNSDLPRYWEKIGRKSCDHIKTVKMDAAQSYSVPSPQGLCFQHYHCQDQSPNSNHVHSPMHRTNRNLSSPFPTTPLSSRRLQVQSASPRCMKDERNLIMAQSPTLGSSHHRMFMHENGVVASMPNYMAATASAKARRRFESASRQRLLTPERENVCYVKKRLSFPDPEPDACAVMSDVESERSLRRRSCTLLRRQPSW